MFRTDLALEERELYREKISAEEPDGVKHEKYRADGCSVERVDIINEKGAELLHKAQGSYVTVTPDEVFSRRDDAFRSACLVIAKEIKKLIKIPPKGAVLVAALGNRAITPDALGAFTAENILVTRHLVEKIPRFFDAFRPVCLITPGVMGTTGIETKDYVNQIARSASPSLIIAVDALVSRRTERLCRTVQISTAGIAPGSGTRGESPEISTATMSLPVLAIGVPTIVDSRTLIRDALEKAGVRADNAILGESAMVTGKDIDEKVKRMGALIGCSINLALHDGLNFSQMETFLA